MAGIFLRLARRTRTRVLADGNDLMLQLANEYVLNPFGLLGTRK